MKYAKRTERLQLRLTTAERAAIERGAKHARKDLTSYVLARVLSPSEAARLIPPSVPDTEPSAQNQGWLGWLVGRPVGRGR